MRFFRIFSVAIILCLSVAASKAQSAYPSNWVAKEPFEQKVFIENKGQYEIPGKAGVNEILYGARQGGLQYYFTNHGIWLKRFVSVKRTEQEMEELQQKSGMKKVDDDDSKLKYKLVEEFHQIEFEGAG